MYKVRKSWSDVKSQVGAYISLDNAKKQADKYGYNVYDDTGNLIYPNNAKLEKIYRVRKSWIEPKTQIGAFKDLINAKELCDKNPGYSIFDENGKLLYTSEVQKEKKKQTISTAFNTYTFLDINKTKNISGKASSGLALTYSSSNKNVVVVDNKGVMTAKGGGSAIITIKQNGNDVFDAAIKTISIAVPKWKTFNEIVAPIYNAAVAQAKQQQNYTYAWKGANKQTIADSKKYGTCVTYVNCILYRLNILKEKSYIYQNSKGKVELCGATTALQKDAAAKAKKYLTITQISNVRPIKLKDKLKRGDILMYTNGTIKAGGGNHICVFSGKFSGNYAIVWDNNWAKAQMKSEKKFNQPLDSYTRIKQFKVFTECTNGVITTSNTYLAAQSVKIAYRPSNKETLKSVVVDGKAIDIKKYPSSYTFSNLSSNHTIVVTYN